MQAINTKTTEKIDWTAALQKFIKKEFTKDTFETHKEAIEKVNGMRRDVTQATERTEAVANLYLRYYHVIGHIDQRFPVNEDNIKLDFKWTDAFKGKATKLHRISFERACLLFNVAAIYTNIAAQQNYNSMDGLKDACKYFQIAAGFFAQLKEDIVFVVGQLSPDLTTDGISACLNLCLAQAQECFAERAYRQNMKPSIVAPLASSAAHFYELVIKDISSPFMTSSVDRNWIQFANFKFNYMMALHHFCLSRASHDDDKYGQEVAYLALSDSHLNKCRQFGVSPDASGASNALGALVQRAYQSAIKDNEQVYHERVPRPEELPPASLKDMVKPAPIKTLLEAQRGGSELFAELLPLGVKKSVDKYHEDKAKLVLKFSDDLKDHDKAIQTKLQELNLPDCLHVMDSAAIPEGLQSDITSFKASNGVAHLQETHKQVASMSEESRLMHRSIIKSLDDEEHEDTELCQRFGRVWSRMPSSQLNRGFRGDLATYNHNIEAARKSDTVLQSKFDSYKPEFEMLLLPQQQLEALVPSGVPESIIDTQGQDVKIQLRDLLNQLDAIIAERVTLLKEAETLAAQETGIIAELLKGGKAHEDIIAHALSVMDPVRQKSADLLAKQQALLEQVVSAHATFMKQRTSSTLLQAKEAAVKRLRDAVNHFREIKSNITEGFEFYSRMQDVLRQLKQKVDDFLLARQTEKEDLMQRIQLQQSQPQQPQFHQPPQYQSGFVPQPQTPLYQQQQQPHYGAPTTQQQPQYPGGYQQPSYQPPQEYSGQYNRR